MTDSLYRFELHKGFVVPIAVADPLGVAVEPDGTTIVDEHQANQLTGFSLETLRDLHEHFAARLLPACADARLAPGADGDAVLRQRYHHLPLEFYHQFLRQCQAVGIDPWLPGLNPEVQCDERSGRRKLVFIVSINLMRGRAGEHPRFLTQHGPLFQRDDGSWVEAWTTKATPQAAKVGIELRDASAPLWAVATWQTYAPYVETRNGPELVPLWEQRGDMMLGTCAEAMALRRAFGDLFAGVYCSAEMEQRHNRRKQVPSRAVPKVTPLDDERRLVISDEYSQV